MSTLCQTWDYKLEIQGPSTHSSIAQSRNGTQGWQHYISERWVHLEDRKYGISEPVTFGMKQNGVQHDLVSSSRVLGSAMHRA